MQNVAHLTFFLEPELLSTVNFLSLVRLVKMLLGIIKGDVHSYSIASGFSFQ